MDETVHDKDMRTQQTASLSGPNGSLAKEQRLILRSLFVLVGYSRRERRWNNLFLSLPVKNLLFIQKVQLDHNGDNKKKGKELYSFFSNESIMLLMVTEAMFIKSNTDWAGNHL